MRYTRQLSVLVCHNRNASTHGRTRNPAVNIDTAFPVLTRCTAWLRGGWQRETLALRRARQVWYG